MSHEHDEESAPSDDKSYDLMLQLERLESLREEMEEQGFVTRGQVEAALTTNPAAAIRETLQEILDDLRDFDLPDTAALEREIDRLNEELDSLDD